MKAVSGKDLARLVVTRGWVLPRVHGSHYIYGGNKPLKIGLRRHLMKLADFAESDL